jgi:phytoene dehydrogenase-like protein
MARLLSGPARSEGPVKYDTVIIGAGLSGLAAGIRLAYFDKSVCIVEKHYTIGGLNSFYRLRKRDHDVGLHAVTNYAEPGTKTGPLSKLLRQLRLRWDDFALCPQVESSIAFPGRTLKFTNDFDFLHQNIVEEFPDQKDGFAKLLKLIDEHDELHLGDETASARKILNEHLSNPTLVDMLFCPLMFYGSPTAGDMDFSQFVIMFKSIFYEGFGRPIRGVRLIMKNLVKQFRGNGGELKLKSGVQKVISENGQATGVLLESGEVLEARNIVSSAGIAETLRLCETPQEVSSENEPGGISFVETIFSLDCQPQEFGHDQTIVFYNDSDTFRYEPPEEPCDVRSGIICSPNNFRYDSDETEEGRIRITALADPAFWLNQSDENYDSAKTEWTERIVESALRYMPDFRQHVVDTDAFTPRTIKKFTGHLNGAVYGAPKKLRDGTTHLKNLFLCGTDQGFLGIIGSMLSGITIANLHLLRQK